MNIEQMIKYLQQTGWVLEESYPGHSVVYGKGEYWVTVPLRGSFAELEVRMNDCISVIARQEGRHPWADLIRDIEGGTYE